MKTFLRGRLRGYRRTKYLRSGRRAWSYGYGDYKNSFIDRVLGEDELLQIFRTGAPLPVGYGTGIDERAVEIPWVLSQLPNEGTGHLLDAGSALNHEYMLQARPLTRSKITIMTLAPEALAFWDRGISYVFGDLRHVDFRDDCFDTVTCISTIEHVGMDNAMYAKGSEIARPGDMREFLGAVRELNRILKPGGTLYITFPFGRYENHGWLQQFDVALTDALIEAFHAAEAKETIFRYDRDGWRLSDRHDSSRCEYSNAGLSAACGGTSSAPDNAAAARAVACLALRK